MCRQCVLVMILAALFFVPVGPVAGAEGGSGHEGGGQGGGCGDVLGDLVHIKRDAVTGQPILQKRWIELPQDAMDWGYCPIALDAEGEEIGFVENSCDPLDVEAVIEVDYFGRLSGGRTKERNSRMHFNEVIANIKMAGRVLQDQTGRLLLGFDCAEVGAHRCEEWKTVDSPMENLALYTRLMKYGHLQTDPMEVDTFAHGDPAAAVQYHPALAPEDWAKFSGGLKHLLPGGGNQAGACFEAGFNPQCAETEALDSRDLVRGATFLGAAANKDGKITVDLVQYLNRILKVPLATEATAATLETLPALIRDCGDNPLLQLPPEQCVIVAAGPDLPAPANERFVDFGRIEYEREEWRDEPLTVLVPLGGELWQETPEVNLLDWLEYVNGAPPEDPITGVRGFVSAASDGLRAIQFVHNYDIPADLGWDFD